MSESYSPSTTKRIFITGASGCIGHYIVDALMQQTDYELVLLVRNPEKLRLDVEARPGVTVLQGDMRQIEQFADVLQTIDVAILTATAWGGDQEVYDINVVKTMQLMELLDPDVCEQVIYFSTASILGRDNQPLKQANELGTPYIRSKYACHQLLPRLAIAPKITTLFPTLVFGGDDQKPASQISAGLPDVLRWMNLIRFLKADGSFHFIHAQDIAQVVVHLCGQPPSEDAPHELVLGNPAVTVNEAIAQICSYLNKPVSLRIPLSMQLADLLIPLFQIQMAAWDRFCLRYRHFVYDNPVNPASLGRSPYCATIAELLNVSGIHLSPAKPESQTSPSPMS